MLPFFSHYRNRGSFRSYGKRASSLQQRRLFLVHITPRAQQQEFIPHSRYARVECDVTLHHRNTLVMGYRKMLVERSRLVQYKYDRSLCMCRKSRQVPTSPTARAAVTKTTGLFLTANSWFKTYPSIQVVCWCVAVQKLCNNMVQTLVGKVVNVRLRT